ncbi:MAG: IS1380 family transposase [Chloroflexi bacterium]|nr:IS1380 family transposase [Chloroflexota bacterium]
MIDRIEFTARHLTSNAGLLFLLENTRKNGIFEWIDQELVFGNRSTDQIKMNHIQTLLCGNFIGIDKLERLKLLQGDPLVQECSITVKEPETVSRFLSNFSYTTTQMLREVNFRLFRKLLQSKPLPAITIDIDSSVVNVEGRQEGTAKGYNPKKPGNPCYNLQFAFCDELKAFISGYLRSGDTYTSNGAAGLIQEIVAQIQDLSANITFRMDSGYFDEAILETIETLECTYVIKAKGYPTLVSKASDPGLTFVPGEDGRETAELVVALDSWKKARRFIVKRVRKDPTQTTQLSFLPGDEFEYFFYVTNTDLHAEAMVAFYEKRGNAENYIKEAKYDMAVGHLLLRSFWANEAIFQLTMMAYNLFLLFKMDRGMKTEYRQQIKTFRLKYIFLAGKIVRSARLVVLKLPEQYAHQPIFSQI